MAAVTIPVKKSIDMKITSVTSAESQPPKIAAMKPPISPAIVQIDKLEKSHDDILTFEEMGIDKLIVDESHEFKNVPTQTKLSNVAGISSSASQKALDLFMKCRYLDEKTGGRGVIMATGTPLSNSVTELHTMMRFLEYDFLKDHGLANFDNWVTVFGEQKTEWELAPAGNKIPVFYGLVNLNIIKSTSNLAILRYFSLLMQGHYFYYSMACR